MMGTSGDKSITYTLFGRDKGLKSVLKDAEDQADKTEKGMKGLGSTLKAAGSMWVASEAVGKIKDFFSESITAASDLNETISKTRSVFGPASDDMIAFGKNAASALGQSQTEALDAADNLGNLFMNMGITTDKSATMSKQLVTTASDLASFFNADPSEMLGNVQSALAGEYDPLQRYGMAISAAAVQQEALTSGLAATKDEITPAIQAQATYALILKNTGAASGDFAKTADGMANSQRILQAEFENTKAQLGTQLLPIMLEATKGAMGLLNVFTALPGPVQTGALVLGGVALAGVAVGKAVGACKEAMDDLGLSFRRASTEAQASTGRWDTARGKLGELKSGAIAVSASLTAMQVAGQAFGSDATVGVNTASKALEEYAKTGKMSDAITKDLGYDLGTIADTTWGDSFSNGSAKAIESLTGLGSVFDNSVEHASERLHSIDAGLTAMAQGGKADQAAEAFKRLSDAATADGITIDALKRAMPEYINYLDGAAAAAKKTTPATQDLTAAQKKLSDEAKAAKEAFKAQNEALDTSKNLFLQGRDAESQYWASLDAVKAALKENGTTLDVHTEKGRANRAALDEQADASGRYLQGILSQSGPGLTFNQNLVAQRNALIQAAEKFGAGSEAAKKYADQILFIPKSASTTVVANTAAAEAQVRAFRALLDGIQRSVVVSVGLATSTVGRARGGWIPGAPSATDSVSIMAAPGEYVVNSEAAQKWGPMLEAINSGGMASGGGQASVGSAGGGAAVVYNVYVSNAIVGNEENIQRVVTDALRRVQARGGS